MQSRHEGPLSEHRYAAATVLTRVLPIRFKFQFIVGNRTLG